MLESVDVDPRRRDHAAGWDVDFQGLLVRRISNRDDPDLVALGQQVLGELAKTGRHRVPIPDLVIAAAAESADLTVLHYDRDFELIAEVTGQATDWVVPRGSL